MLSLCHKVTWPTYSTIVEGRTLSVGIEDNAIEVDCPEREYHELPFHINIK